MWAGLVFAASLLILVSAEGGEFSNSRQAGGNSKHHNGVTVAEHHLHKHTKNHNPCTFHHCSSQQICKVIVNPALQFPIPHCEDAFSPADGKLPTSSVACAEQELSTDPMGCKTEATWRAQALAKCGKTKMDGFQVKIQCLSFDPAPVYQFASFKCCDHTAPKPKPRQPNPPKKKTPRTPGKKTHQAPAKKAPVQPDQNPQPPMPDQPSKANTPPQVPTLPPTDEPVTKNTKSQSKTEKPPRDAGPPKIKAPQPPAVKPTVPIADVPARDAGPPKGQPVEVVDEPNANMNEKERSGSDTREESALGDHWLGIIPATLAVVVLIAVVVAVVYRMKTKNQVLHRSRRQLAGTKGKDLAFASVVMGNDGQDLFSPEADGLAFDDTELENFVNPVAVFVNTQAEADGCETLSEEPADVRDWDMDADSLNPKMTNSKRRKN